MNPSEVNYIEIDYGTHVNKWWVHEFIRMNKGNAVMKLHAKGRIKIIVHNNKGETKDI